MQFLYPTFLFAMAALAIPIILHLFYFRRFKKVYFTNIRFLKEVKEETSARSKLRNLLVLIARLLAIAFLVFAFAQPFIPQDVEVKKGRKSVSLFVDNSFSMSALSQDVPLIEKAKQRAREIVNAYNIEDRFQILTNDFEGRHQRLVSQEDALSLIDEIETGPSVRELTNVLARQQQALELFETDNHFSYLISDFQRNITDFQNHTDTTVEISLVPLQSVQERNISIDSAWFETPVQMLNQPTPLVVRVRNHTNEAVDNIRLTFRHEGQTKPVGTLSIPANASVVDTVNITILRTGWHEAELAITDYPVQFDDKYFFTFHVAEQINVLVINEVTPNPYLNASFAGISYIDVTNQFSRNLDYSMFPGYQLIIMNGLKSISSGLSFELNQYVNSGGNLLVFPGTEANISSYQSFLRSFPSNELVAFEKQERKVGRVNMDEFIFSDVFENKNANLTLPVTQGNYRLSNYGSRSGEQLLTYRDGSTFLSKYLISEGHLYLCSAPLDENYNNIVRNGEVFIPMLYNMAISVAQQPKIAYSIGRDEVIEADNVISESEMVYKIRGASEEFIPQQRIIGGAKVLLSINNQIDEAGFYNLFLQEEEILSKYAFNYDRKESRLDYYNKEDLKSMVNDHMQIIDATSHANFTTLIGERSQGVVLWRWCLMLALLFLAVEILLLRFWKI
ncbi:MAG: hypothetical protein GY705_07745 [Bacteroidetes bacterium]|nr:hypothetical protein [Bacteroidota bacterium]